MTHNDQIRREIIEKAKEFYSARPVPEFEPGKTYIPVTVKVVDSDDLGLLIDASLDMWLTTGRFGNEFEATLPAFLGRKTKALLVNSGSSANLVAISSFGSPSLSEFSYGPLKPGDEVITVAAGFPTTVNPIVQNGWVPVFVDVDRETINALPEKIMSARTPKTRAVVLAHTLGNCYRADLIKQWCDQEKLYLIEDCCDAFGAEISGAPAGSYGHFSTLSFYPAHHITMGEGGAVLSIDGRFKKIAESFRDWGRDCWCEPGKDNTCKKRFDQQLGDLPHGYDHKYIYSHVGYNLKVTDMQAALGVSQLKKVNGFIEARRKNWQYLNAGINSSPLLKQHLTPVLPTKDTKPSWFGFAMYCSPALDRNKMVRSLEARKVGTRLLFAGSLIKQPAYRNVNYRIHGALENTDLIMNQLFWIGVHPALNQAKMDYMLESLEALVKEQI